MCSPLGCAAQSSDHTERPKPAPPFLPSSIGAAVLSRWPMYWDAGCCCPRQAGPSCRGRWTQCRRSSCPGPDSIGVNCFFGGESSTRGESLSCPAAFRPFAFRRSLALDAGFDLLHPLFQVPDQMPQLRKAGNDRLGFHPRLMRHDGRP